MQVFFFLKGAAGQCLLDCLKERSVHSCSKMQPFLSCFCSSVNGAHYLPPSHQKKRTAELLILISMCFKIKKKPIANKHLSFIRRLMEYKTKEKIQISKNGKEKTAQKQFLQDGINKVNAVFTEINWRNDCSCRCEPAQVKGFENQYMLPAEWPSRLHVVARD